MPNESFLASPLSASAALTLPLAACGDPKRHCDQGEDFGPSPKLPEPKQSLDPDRQYRDGEPLAGRRQADRRQGHDGDGLRRPGSTIRAWLYVLPNGDVLVAESNAPPKPDDGKGIKGLSASRRRTGRRRGAERQPHHAAARCRRRRRRGDAQRCFSRA